MKVSEAMTRGVEFAPADATVQEAATAMAEHDIGAILVGSPEALKGILTDRDIILRLVVDARDAAGTTVGEIMSSTLFTCRDEDAVETALAIMDERQVRRLPVVDAEDRVVGIVVQRDLLRAQHDQAEAKQPAVVRD